MTAEIRHARPDDAPLLSAIASAAYAVYLPLMDKEPAPMLADYARHISQDMVFVLVEDDALCGFAVITRAQNRYWLDNIAVMPGQQGRGYGAQLIRACEQFLAPLTDSYHLYTNICMADNIAWYRRIGFVQTDRRKIDGYDRLYFEKDLSSERA